MGWYDADIDRVIITEEEIRTKTAELAKQVATDYASVDGLLLVCVLKGAAMFMADFARELGKAVQAITRRYENFDKVYGACADSRYAINVEEGEGSLAELVNFVQE